MTGWWRPLAVVMILTGMVSPALAQLQVEGKPHWGFDGKARIGQFNLLTVQFFNPSDRPWEGDLLLEAQAGLGHVDIPILHPGLFVEPYGQRQIQFLVFLPQPSDYLLRWGRGRINQFRIDEPDVASKPAVVQITGDLDASPGMRGVPRFPASAFPPSAAGLDGLGTVLLSRVPRWNEPQRQAFRDWLAAGGTMHLYHATGGEFPVFPAGLTELNEPSDEFTVGSGRVIRHASTIQQASNPFSQSEESSATRYSEWQTTSNLLTLLREMTIPEHNWTLIYLLAVVYLLLLFPGCWLLGRRRGDYRITYAAVLGTVFVFSMGFHTVGARGYGERTSINSVAIAKPAADGRVVLTQWSNLFVTGGGQYAVKHHAEGLAYSTGQLFEAVLGRALNRPQGAMLVDAPAFSARGIVHTGVLPGEAINLQVEEIRVENNRLRGLRMRLPEDVAGNPDPLFQAQALYRDRLYALKPQAGGAYSISGEQPLTNVLDPQQWSVYQNPWQRSRFETEELYRRTFGPLIAHDLGITGQADRDAFALPLDELRIYLFTPMPEAFFAGGDTSSQQSGRVLYVVNVQVEQ
jgi:hypothetical protein